MNSDEYSILPGLAQWIVTCQWVVNNSAFCLSAGNYRSWVYQGFSLSFPYGWLSLPVEVKIWIFQTRWQIRMSSLHSSKVGWTAKYFSQLPPINYSDDICVKISIRL